MFKHTQKINNLHLTGEIAAYLYFKAEFVVENIVSKELAWKNVYVHHISACVSACQVNTVGGVLENDLLPIAWPVFGSSHIFFSQFTATSWKIMGKPFNCVMIQT